MGLPGSGKTTLAQELKKQLQQAGRTVEWLNADEVRTTYNDWDFSESGRIRQSQRMRELADKFVTDYVIADFVAPLAEMRENCTFVRITGAGLKESHVHDVQITRESPNYPGGRG
jgi:adenylylsulfate kinase-like enzyme